MRLTNLVQNSKLDLVAASARDKVVEARPVDVTIKLQVEDLASSFSANLVETFKSTMTLWAVLAYFERKSGINFTGRTVMHQVTSGSGYLVFEAPVVQSFNKRIKDLDEYGKTLGVLGLRNKQETLRIRFEKTDIPFQDVVERNAELMGEGIVVADRDSATAKTVTPAPIHDAVPPTTETPELPSEQASSPSAFPETEVSPHSRSIQVYLPSQTARVIADDDDDQFVVSLSHAQKLQDQIHRTSKSSDGPLLTKSLRQKMQDDKIDTVKTIQIRIRLPDQTHLEASFKSTESIGDLHTFVKESLIDPALPFRVFTNPPKTFYIDHKALLVRDCKFSPRTLLFLEWNHDAGVPKDKFPKTGLLRPEVLSQGISITEAPDVKLDTKSPGADETRGKKLSDTGSSEEKKKTSWMNKGPLSASQKATLMKFVKTGKKN